MAGFRCKFISEWHVARHREFVIAAMIVCFRREFVAKRNAALFIVPHGEDGELLGQVTAFAAAIVNIGAMGTIQIGSEDGQLAWGLTADICETDPVSGQCIGPRSALIEVEIGRNEVRTFTVFARSNGTEIPFSPLTNRISFVGDTSIAYRTIPAR